MRRFRGNTWFWILIALMAMSSLRQYSSPMEWLLMKVLTLPGIIIGLSFHEYAHAKAAELLGDPTAKNQGRCSLNPMAHFDPFGFLALLFLGFGWGVAVPYNPYNLKNRKSGEIIISIAGVATNLILAFVFGAIYVLMYKAGYYPGISGPMNSLCLAFYFVIQINLVLMIFNLLPIPPLDGFGLLDAIIGFKGSRALEFLRTNGFLILMFLILFNVVDLILSPAVSALMNGILNIWAGILL